MKRNYLAWLSLLLLGAGFPEEQLQWDGRSWSYFRVVPPGLTRPALVLLFHGAGNSADRIMERSAWCKKAALEGFVLVAPNAQPPRPLEPLDSVKNPRRWTDEVEFAETLREHCLQSYQCDPSRVYLVGHSNGAKFSYLVAATHPDRYAALAIISGLLPPKLPEGPLTPVIPTIAFHGEEDGILPLRGGHVQSPWGPRQYLPISEQLSQWAQMLGYSGRSERCWEDDLQFTDRYGPQFHVIYLRGHGHSYPSPDNILTDPRFGPLRADVPVNDLVWEFFRLHPAPRPWFAPDSPQPSTGTTTPPQTPPEHLPDNGPPGKSD